MKLRPHHIIGLAGVCFTLSSHAAFDAFLKLEGVEGEATASGHKDWIEVASVSSSFLPAGPLARNPTSALHFTKLTDKSSPVLFARCAAGTPLAWAKLEFMQTTPSAVRYFDIRMSNVLITAASVLADSTSPSDRPSESLSLNFTKIEWTYTSARPVSRLPAELRATQWNLLTNAGDGTTNQAAFTATGIRESSGNVILNWQAVAGKTYDIYACPDPTGPYSLHSQLTPDTTGPINHRVPNTPGAMFFAVEERP
jgi:type VI secretion system Hcp family effector